MGKDSRPDIVEPNGAREPARKQVLIANILSDSKEGKPNRATSPGTPFDGDNVSTYIRRCDLCHRCKKNGSISVPRSGIITSTPRIGCDGQAWVRRSKFGARAGGTPIRSDGPDRIKIVSQAGRAFSSPIFHRTKETTSCALILFLKTDFSFPAYFLRSRFSPRHFSWPSSVLRRIQLPEI